MNPRVRFLSVVLCAALASSALVGCDDDADSADAVSTDSVSAPVSPTPSVSSPPAPDPADALKVLTRSTRVTCAEVDRRTDLGLWESSVKANAPLRIVSVQGMGAEVPGAIGVPVVKPRVQGAVLSEWPPTIGTGLLARSVDWKARANLVGMHLDAGDEVRVILHLVGRPGGRLDKVEIGFALDENDAGASVALPVGTRFARHC